MNFNLTNDHRISVLNLKVFIEYLFKKLTIFSWHRLLILLLIVASGGCQKTQSKGVDFDNSQLSVQICTEETGALKCIQSQESLPDLFKPKVIDPIVMEYYREFGLPKTYFYPTEFHPEPLHEALGNLIKKMAAPRSAQITVGTERGFLTASADYLILADSDPIVQLYNVINIGLLKAASNIESYRQLRFAKNLDVWKKNKVQIRSTLDYETIFKFWREAQTYESLIILSTPPKDRLSYIKEAFGPIAFSRRIPLDNDYVWNNDRFLKLQQMAKSDRIFVYDVDLTKSTQVDELKRVISKYSLTVVSLDLSNIHHYVKLGEGLLDTMNKFKSSYIVVSQLHSNFNGKPTRLFPNFNFFRYYIFKPTGQYEFMIKNVIEPNLPPLATLDGPIVSLLDGHKIVTVPTTQDDPKKPQSPCRASKI